MPANSGGGSEPGKCRNQDMHADSPDLLALAVRLDSIEDNVTPTAPKPFMKLVSLLDTAKELVSQMAG